MKEIRLHLVGDRVHARIQEEESVPVSIVWARPASAPGKEISILQDESEIAFLDGLHQLDEESRVVAESALTNGYFIAEISTITRVSIHMGNRYFDAVTNRGKRTFLLKNPYTNIRQVGIDGLLMRDALGNLFSIESLSKLDKRSQAEIAKAL